MTRPSSLASQSGLSLVEVLVAIVILSIATVGLFRTFDQATFTVAAGRDRILASMIARNEAEALQIAEPHEQSPLLFAGRPWETSITRTATTGGGERVIINVLSDDGNAKVSLVAYLMHGSGQ